jgi:hypothetical protein
MSRMGGWMIYYIYFIVLIVCWAGQLGRGGLDARECV